MKPAFRVLFAFVLALMLCAPAMADVLTFYGDNTPSAPNWTGKTYVSENDAETEFQSILEAVYIEDFSSGTNIDYGNGITGTASHGTINSEAWNTGSGNGSLTFGFSAPVNAFGFYVYDVDAGANLHATVNSIDYDIPHYTTSAYLDGDIHFWGIVDTVNTFTQVTLTGLRMHFNWDDLQIGTQIATNEINGPVPTPEPSTFLLLAAGLGGVAFLRRKLA